LKREDEPLDSTTFPFAPQLPQLKNTEPFNLDTFLSRMQSDFEERNDKQAQRAKQSQWRTPQEMKAIEAKRKRLMGIISQKLHETKATTSTSRSTEVEKSG
jgi:hypothetical protein